MNDEAITSELPYDFLIVHKQTPESFGDRLRKLRGPDLSQEALAAATGVARNTIYRLEANKAKPELDTLLALSAYFGMGLDELVRGQTCVPRPTISEQATEIARQSAREAIAEVLPQLKAAGLQQAAKIKQSDELDSETLGIAREIQPLKPADRRMVQSVLDGIRKRDKMQKPATPADKKRSAG